MALGRQAGDAQHDRCETLMRISLEGDSTLHSDETRNGTKRRFFVFFLVNQVEKGRKQDKLGHAPVNTSNEGTLSTFNEKRSLQRVYISEVV